MKARIPTPDKFSARTLRMGGGRRNSTVESARLRQHLTQRSTWSRHAYQFIHTLLAAALGVLGASYSDIQAADCRSNPRSDRRALSMTGQTPHANLQFNIRVARRSHFFFDLVCNGARFPSVLRANSAFLSPLANRPVSPDLQILASVDAGGMGEVYRAVLPKLFNARPK
jgi:hypothetical protein